MSARHCPFCGGEHNDICPKVVAARAKRGLPPIWHPANPGEAGIITKPLIINKKCPECGKRAHWGACKAPRPRYFPGDPGYDISEVERAERIAAGLPMIAEAVTKPQTAPVEPVDKPELRGAVTELRDAVTPLRGAVTQPETDGAPRRLSPAERKRASRAARAKPGTPGHET